MTRFSDWDKAHRFYTDKYNSNGILLVSDAEGRTVDPPAPLAIPRPNPQPNISIAPVQPVVAVSTDVHPAAGTPAAPAVLPTASALLARMLIEPLNVNGEGPFTGILNSPFGRDGNPIYVASAFPTPQLSSRTQSSQPKSGGLAERYRKAILRARRSPSATCSTLAKAIHLARKKPTPGPSKVKRSVLGKKPSAATRVIRNTRGVISTSRGKGKARAKVVHGDSEDSDVDILVFCESDSDDSDPFDETAGTSHSMVLRPRIVPLVYPQATPVNPSSDAGPSSSVPAVTITAPTGPATQATDDISRYNPFHHSPLKHLLNPAPATPPRVSNTTVSNSPASFEELVESASRTPTGRSAGSQRRFEIIDRTIQNAPETPKAGEPWTPKSAASQRRFEIIDQAIQNLNNKASTARTTTPAPTSPLPQYSTPTSNSDHTIATTSSDPTGNIPTNNPILSSVHSSPETEYGLSSDLDAEFLEQAAHLLDQVYTKPGI